MISFVLRVKNEASSLEKMLPLLHQQSINCPIEIIIVDSDSTDGTKELARNYNCTIINLPSSDFSWGKALNRGIEASTGAYCVLFSSHSYPTSSFTVSKLIEPLEKNPTIAASYGRQIPIQHLNPFEEIELDFSYPEFEDGRNLFASSANSCIRRSVWAEIKFDETLSSCEDGDWALRVQNAGYRIKYVPSGTIYHSHKIDVMGIYQKWYWRQRLISYVYRTDKKVVLASSVPLFSLFFAICRYFLWTFRTTFYFLKNRYPHLLWKIPFHEFIRIYGLYRGMKDGFADLRLNRQNKFQYYSLKKPAFLEKFKFIEG